MMYQEVFPHRRYNASVRYTDCMLYSTMVLPFETRAKSFTYACIIWSYRAL